MRAFSFPPVVSAGAQVLVLGTLPGQASLRVGQYYAHPRNVFWSIMADWFGMPANASYEARIRAVTEGGLGLWNVCASAYRPGSLDAAITVSSVVANDFNAFLAEYPGIRLICFNGAAAARLFQRFVVPGLLAPWDRLPRIVLPSTSPAHAAMSFAEKLSRWSMAVLPELAG